jgi:DNA invertase Pin-like site-specific DNA recombinase
MLGRISDGGHESALSANGRAASAARLLGYVKTNLRHSDGSAKIAALQGVGAHPIFVDNAQHADEQEVGLRRVFDVASRGDTLAVVSLYELGTSLRAVLSVVDNLHARGIDLLSIEDGINTSSGASDPIFNTFAAVSSYVHRVRSERIKNGISIAHGKGVRSGRVLDMAKVDSAMELVKAGVPPREVAARVGLGASTIYREMRRLGVERPL